LSLCLFLTEHHVMKAYWGNGGIAPCILWPWHKMELSGQLHALDALPPGKEPLVHTGQEAGWVPEPFWTWWREKFPVSTRNQTPESQSSSQ
jgi:hypothetical protein